MVLTGSLVSRVDLFGLLLMLGRSPASWRRPGTEMLVLVGLPGSRVCRAQLGIAGAPEFGKIETIGGAICRSPIVCFFLREVDESLLVVL